MTHRTRWQRFKHWPSHAVERFWDQPCSIHDGHNGPPDFTTEDTTP